MNFWVECILSGKRFSGWNTGLLKAVLFGVFFFFLSVFAAVSPSASAAWLPVSDYNLQIKKSSALDFSGLFAEDDVPLSENIVLLPSGHLGVLTDNGRRQVRLFCASLAFSPLQGGFPSHSEAKQLAEQLKLRGYNIARFHFVDAMLMSGQKNDFDYNPQQLDRFHYLLHALKQQGIRWAIDAASSPNGAYGDIKPHRWVNKKKLKERIYFEEEAREHWREMVRTILAQPNKYTGTVILEDPALVYVTLFNEMGLGFVFRNGYSPLLKQKFVQWRRKKYPDRADSPVPGRRDRSPDAAFMQEFLAETEKTTAQWMSDFLRSLGYRGLITSFNNGKYLQTAASRRYFDLVTVHGYHDHPSDFIREGSTQKAVSSFDDFLAYYRKLAADRIWGKAFAVEEYDQPYWNPYRREAGLVVPALASFQGWDMICRYTNPVQLRYDPDGPRRSRAIHPFGVGMDPVATAGEILAALLYRRGDVQPAAHKVGLMVSNNEMLGAYSGVKGIPDQLSMISLVTGVGLDINGTSDDNNLVFKVHLEDNWNWRRLFGRRGSLKGWSGILGRLRDGGIITGGNNTDGDGSIFVADTGQVTIEPKKKTMSVITPMTEAVVFDSVEKPVELKRLSVISADNPALVALSSIDGETLENSGSSKNCERTVCP